MYMYAIRFRPQLIAIPAKSSCSIQHHRNNPYGANMEGWGWLFCLNRISKHDFCCFYNLGQKGYIITVIFSWHVGKWTSEVLNVAGNTLAREDRFSTPLLLYIGNVNWARSRHKKRPKLWRCGKRFSPHHHVYLSFEEIRHPLWGIAAFILCATRKDMGPICESHLFEISTNQIDKAKYYLQQSHLWISEKCRVTLRRSELF